MNELNDDYLCKLLEKAKCAEALANQVHTLFFSARMIAGLIVPCDSTHDCSGLKGGGLHACRTEPQSLHRLAAEMRNSINSLDADIRGFSPVAEQLLVEITSYMSNAGSQEKFYKLSDAYSNLSLHLAVLKEFAVFS